MSCYLCEDAYQYERKTSPTTVYGNACALLKIDHTTNAVTTLLTTVQLGRRGSIRRAGVDIDSGKVMVFDSSYLSSPTTMKYPVLTLNPEDGYNPANVGTWNDGSKYGWPYYTYGVEQNHIPHLPGKSYALAAGASGVRPGIALGDGRNINLNFDVVAYVTLTNQLPGIWNPGTQTLDASGNAAGTLDLSSLAVPKDGFGVALWIAVAVLDTSAPSGIAYVPDTYVMCI